MRSRLQLDVRTLSLGRRHLVNAYELKAGIGVIAGNTAWAPRRFTTRRYINPLYLYLQLYVSSHNEDAARCVYVAISKREAGTRGTTLIQVIHKVSSLIVHYTRDLHACCAALYVGGCTKYSRSDLLGLYLVVHSTLLCVLCDISSGCSNCVLPDGELHSFFSHFLENHTFLSETK